MSCEVSLTSGYMSVVKGDEDSDVVPPLSIVDLILLDSSDNCQDFACLCKYRVPATCKLDLRDASLQFRDGMYVPKKLSPDLLTILQEQDVQKTLRF